VLLFPGLALLLRFPLIGVLGKVSSFLNFLFGRDFVENWWP
jgi:hypothetical protein